ncbi:hypothetical protein NDU88_001652 [Pleurodeles waltl]|uniref:Secreted protein n=1 Tax=Pleurodeles waltl TaxID=8319 RepID=A0AAV7LDF1_PLEWA|nr:hypothetical protein NDU88_001652 [Pleurodeles waltl]
MRSGFGVCFRCVRAATPLRTLRGFSRSCRQFCWVYECLIKCLRLQARFQSIAAGRNKVDQTHGCIAGLGTVGATPTQTIY